MSYLGRSPTGSILTGADIADGSISTAKIADTAVSTAKIADTAISTAKIADDAVTVAKTSGVGITHASQWRMSSDVTGGVYPISANLEKVDTDGYSSIGSDMTVSSGLWTFPTTGKWLIRGHADVYFNGDSRHQHFSIYTTTDNSNYNLASTAYMSIKQAESNATQNSCEVDFFFDVTNTTNCKCLFAFENLTNSGVTLAGGSSASYTWFTFLRLGDT